MQCPVSRPLLPQPLLLGSHGVQLQICSQPRARVAQSRPQTALLRQSACASGRSPHAHSRPQTTPRDPAPANGQQGMAQQQSLPRKPRSQPQGRRKRRREGPPQSLAVTPSHRRTTFLDVRMRPAELVRQDRLQDLQNPPAQFLAKQVGHTPRPRAAQPARLPRQPGRHRPRAQGRQRRQNSPRNNRRRTCVSSWTQRELSSTPPSPIP